MALITPQQIPITGFTPSYQAVSASDTVQPDGNDNLILHVRNTGGSIDTVTIVIPGVYLGVSIADLTFNVNATLGSIMMALPAAAMDPATGLITITHSFITSVTCAVLRR